ncbi:hypothetical protein ACWEN6_24980 [Sphaerisporangium sp. NPDC004334]
MPADVRDVTAVVHEGSGSIPRPAVAAGDVMFLFASTWVDPLGELGPPSGGWGTPIVDQVGLDNGGVRVWRKTATSSEPDEYDVPAPEEFADVTLAVLTVKGGDPSAVQVDVRQLTFVTDTALTPAITPATASSLDVRFVSAVPTGGTPADHIGVPAGFTEQAIQDSSVFLVSTLATRALVSSEPLPIVAFPAIDGQVRSYVGVTIIVGSKTSVGGGGTPPTPPGFPSFTPTRGNTTMRYTVHDYLTGEYRGDLDKLDQVHMDRREDEAGAWTGFVPIANRREARKLYEIVPLDPTDLSTGPGRLVVHSWRSGELVGANWLHTAIPAKSSKLGLGVTLQGSTLDAYMQSVALTEDVELDGDQLDVARAFILHMAADPRSNPGFQLAGGTSGVVRPLVANVDDFYGKVLRDYAQTHDGFAYVSNPTLVGGTIQRRIDFGSPHMVLDEEYVFTEGYHGGEVTEWKEIYSALQGGTRFRAIGGTPEAEDATQTTVPMRSSLIEATGHLLAGWPLIDQRPQHPLASTDMTELERYGTYYARRTAGVTRVFSANVVLGKGAAFNFNGIGAMIRFVLNDDWFGNAQRARRLIGYGFTPATRSDGKDMLELIIAEEAA